MQNSLSFFAKTACGNWSFKWLNFTIFLAGTSSSFLGVFGSHKSGSSWRKMVWFWCLYGCNFYCLILQDNKITNPFFIFPLCSPQLSFSVRGSFIIFCSRLSFLFSWVHAVFDKIRRLNRLRPKFWLESDLNHH